jgi:hypothetical protein
MSVPDSCVCAEMFDEGVNKLYSIPTFIIICSIQKYAYFHNTAYYSHLFYFFICSVKFSVRLKSCERRHCHLMSSSNHLKGM